MTTGNLLPSDDIPETNGHDVAAWVPEAREIPAELEPGYDHADYPLPPVHFASVADKISHASLAELREWMQGGIGEPSND